MRNVLRESVHAELVRDHERIGKELASRTRLAIGKTFNALERMLALLSQAASWQKK